MSPHVTLMVALHTATTVYFTAFCWSSFLPWVQLSLILEPLSAAVRVYTWLRAFFPLRSLSFLRIAALGSV